MTNQKIPYHFNGVKMKNKKHTKCRLKYSNNLNNFSNRTDLCNRLSSWRKQKVLSPTL